MTSIHNIWIVFGFAIIMGVLMLFPLVPEGMSQSYHDNTSVITKLNITNVAPVVSGVALYKQGSSPADPIVLQEGVSVPVRCNATVSDNNGYWDIASVSATLFLSGYTGNADNNFKYLDSSCTAAGQIDLISGRFICDFNVWYYANNGTWVCNVTATDLDSRSNYSIDTNTIEALYAINLSTDTIDFGELAPTEVSTDRRLNITNFGNRNLSIAVKGYGVTQGDGLAMDCTMGNVSVGYERYHIQAAQAWEGMNPLTSTFSTISGLKVYQRVDDNDNQNLKSTNATYWKIKAPLGAKGICSGTLIVSAVGP